MTLRVATVLSAREWESRLVAAARATAAIRLVLRAYLPDEVLERGADLDVVVVGSETPWASAVRLRSWSRAGLLVVGVHPAGDRPASVRLAEADLVLPDDLPAETMLREIRLLEPAALRPDPGYPTVAVTGARGAPGRTEVALGIAWLLSGEGPATLVDADLDGPAVAVRLGIEPRPDLADAVDAVHEEGRVRRSGIHPIGNLGVLTGAHRSDEPRLRPEPVFDVVDALRQDGTVIVDNGPWPSGVDIIKSSETAILVVDATPSGIVRAATLLREWAGPQPRLVLNRTPARKPGTVEAALQTWTGLEPSAVISYLPEVRRAAAGGNRPPRRLLKHLIGVLP